MRWAESSKNAARPGPHRCPVGRAESYTQTLGFAGRFDAGGARVSAMWFGIMCSCALAGEPPRVPGASRRTESGQDTENSSCGAWGLQLAPMPHRRSVYLMQPVAVGRIEQKRKATWPAEVSRRPHRLLHVTTRICWQIRRKKRACVCGVVRDHGIMCAHWQACACSRGGPAL